MNVANVSAIVITVIHAVSAYIRWRRSVQVVAIVYLYDQNAEHPDA